MATVTMPDGAIVEMPDQLDPALGARLRAFHDAASAPKPTGALDAVKGVGDAALSGVSKLATGAVGSGAGLVNRLIAAATGGDGQAASDATKADINHRFGYDTQTPVGQKIGGAVSSALAPVGEALGAAGNAIESGGEKIGIPRDFTHSQLSEAGELANLIPAVGGVAKGANAAADAATLATENAPAAVANLGFKTAENSPIARNVAGASGREALTMHNQPLGNTVLGAEAGVPHGTTLSEQTMENARAAPNAVYGRAAAALPEGPLSPGAQAHIAGAGGTGERITDGTPDAQNAIAGLKAQLLDPSRTFSGNQVINEMRGLRQEGYANIGSDDVSKQQLGRAQLDMSRGLEKHVGDTLPADADVSLDQLQGARTALAKNHAVQGALRGPDVDMQAIARMQRADPGLLSGPMADVAAFANQHPEVSSLPGAGARYNPPGLARDIAGMKIDQPNTWAQALFGGLIARRALTGSPAEALEAARAVPVRGLGGEFDPINAPGPQPPPGLTASTPTAPPAAAPGGSPGISLADLLSHGLEQHPAEGLSLGPMGAPAQEGISFQPPPDSIGARPVRSGRQIAEPAPSHIMGEDGPIETGMGAESLVGDRHAAPQLADLLSDLPALLHQGHAGGLEDVINSVLGTTPGVPEGALQRSAKPFKQNKRDRVDMNLSDLLTPTYADIRARDGG